MNDIEPKGKCSCPMWMGGLPSGQCDAPAWGKYIPGETRRDGWTGQVFRVDGGYDGYVPDLACPKHGGPKPDAPRVLQDGTGKDGRPMYFALYPDFINLQESPAVFDQRPWVAVERLLKKHPKP